MVCRNPSGLGIANVDTRHVMVLGFFRISKLDTFVRKIMNIRLTIYLQTKSFESLFSLYFKNIS